VAAAVALAANLLGVAASSAFGWKKAALLIFGCDLMIASLILSTRRRAPAHDTTADLASLSSGAIADGVLMFAASAAALIVLFGQSKPIERLGFFFAILVIVPLGVTLAWRRQRAGLTGERQQLVSFATLAATAAVLCLARLLALSPSATLDTTLFVLLALVAARAGIVLADRLVPATWPQRIPTKAWIAATPLVFAAAAAPFVPLATRSVVDIAIGLVAGLATFDLVRAFRGRWRLPRAWVRVFDVCVVVASTLVVVYLAVPSFGLAANHNYFLGPALDVLHGRAMLVNTFSQYGVGVMDVLAAIFVVVPMGYGTFTLVLSGLTALFFTLFYVVLRWSTESLVIAAVGVTVAVVLDVFGQLDYYTWFPSTGVLRFGLPWLVILFSLASARTVTRKRLFNALVFAVVAVAAVWSGETGVYCLGTAVALACLDAAAGDTPARERVRLAGRRIAQLLATSVCALLMFSLLTRIFAGAWPNWGGYLYYVRLYTTGGFGNLPIEPWSPGLALGAMYTVSAIVIILFVLTRPEFVRERIVAFRAASGLTVLGALVYTYFLGRAHPNNLIHISPPAIALLCVWLGIARLTVNSRVVVAIASGTAVFFGAMIVASEAEDISEKYPTTALAAVLGGAPSLTSELSTLWHNPVVDPSSVHVAQFVSSLGRLRTSTTLLLTPNVETEALVRLGSANAVESSNPCQESLSTQAPGQVAKTVHSLQPGGIVITSTAPNNAGTPLPIEQYTLALLRARFTLREIANDGKGMRAFRMTGFAPVAVPPPAVPAPPLIPTGCG
jgi:hypothetical protein